MFAGIILGFSGFILILGFAGVILGFTKFIWGLLGLTGVYMVYLGFAGFILGIPEFIWSLRGLFWRLQRFAWFICSFPEFMI